MRIGNFSVRIPEGEEKSNDQVRIEHGRQYTIEIGNHGHKRCDAEISIDGEPVATIRLDPRQVVPVEGPTRGDRGRFTAFGAETEEGRDAGSDSISRPNRGLITVRFKPEYQLRHERVAKTCGGPRGQSSFSTNVMRGGGASFTADPRNTVSMCASGPERSAVTGLTGRTDQEWVGASRIDHDPAGEVVINLRLVAINVGTDAVRPLHKGCKKCGCGRKSNAVPATVDD